MLQKTIEYQLPSGLLVIDLIDPGFMSLDTDDREVSMAPPIHIDKYRAGFLDVNIVGCRNWT